MSCRTRFAPSPTGFLHVGGVRTALFSYLLARQNGGQFLLRIEDTDQERLVPGAVRAILEDFRWMGIEIDEGPSHDELVKVDSTLQDVAGIGGPVGPYIQSLRLESYREVAEKLVELGAAYRCDCTPERLQKEREEQTARRVPPGYSGYCRKRNVSKDVKHVIRFKIPSDANIVMDDAIRGPISWQSLALRDTVLLKSDGFPTYHLAVVVDDRAMGITHVLRGEEWIPSAPIHLMIYQALGWEPPIFAHPPSVLGEDGKKLSKRHGATQVSAFRDAGYLPEALMNFLALIGWSPGDGEEQELFSKEELIKRFSLAHVNTAPGVFSYQKLNWMNGMYIRNLSTDELLQRILPFLEKAGLRWDTPLGKERLRMILPHIHERLQLLTEAPGMVEFLLVDTLERDIEAMYVKSVTSEQLAQILDLAAKNLHSLAEFTVAAVDGALRPIVSALSLPAAAVFGAIRIAVTGRKVTPPLNESIVALGKDESVRRVQETIGIIKAR